MPDLLPDVLQSAGLTPHEVGWLQLHAEPVQRAEDGRAVAELWLQAAFHPPGSGRVELVDAASGTTLVEAPLPAVSNGSVVRWRIPFQLPAGTTVVRYQVEAGVPDESARIRAAWKLLDTIELRLPEEDASSGLGIATQLGAVALGGVKDVTGPPRRVSSQHARPSGMKVHSARASRRELVSFVLPAQAEEQFAPAIETLWMTGDPLDAEALKKRVRALPKAAGPTCPNCDAPLVPGGEFCPRCLGPVPGVEPPPLDLPASMLPPLSAMAPHLKSSEAEAEEVASCALHPDRLSTGQCTSCDLFFCDDCASAITPSRCAACEAKLPSRQPLKPQVAYRGTVLVQEFAAFFLVVQGFFRLAVEFKLFEHSLDEALVMVVGLFLRLTVEPSTWTALFFATLGFMPRLVQRPVTLLAIIGGNLLMLVGAVVTASWTVIALASLALAFTTMFWRSLMESGAPRDAPDKELRQATAAVLTPQVYRDASLVHLGAFFILVLRPFVGVALEYRHVFTVVDALPFGGLGVLLFGLRKPFMWPATLGVNLLVMLEAYAIDDWSRLFLTLAVALVTSMLWLRLPDPNALPQQTT